MDPYIACAHRVAHHAHRVERAGVHVPRLGTDDRRPLETGKRVRAHAALVVDRHPHDPVSPKSQHAERLEQRGMGLLAHHHGNRRRREQPVPVGVVAVRKQDRTPGRGERGKVGHRRAGDERRPRIVRQVQGFEHPPQRDLLDRGSDRGAHLAEGVLIPCRREPACGQRRGQGAAGDEAEVPGAGARDHALPADLVEPRENLRCR